MNVTFIKFIDTTYSHSGIEGLELLSHRVLIEQVGRLCVMRANENERQQEKDLS